MISSTTNHASHRRSTRPRSRTGASTGGFLQAVLGWGALVLVLASALANGGFAPVVWNLLSAAMLLILAVQAGLDLKNGISRPAKAALWLVLPYGAALAWLLVQGRTGLPVGLHHPLWSLAPAGAEGTISAHPDASRQLVLRFTLYAGVFWVLARSARAARNGGMAFVQGIALFSTALALYAFASQAIGYNLLLDQEETGAVLTASFLNRNTYATFAVFGTLANVAAYVTVMGGGTLGSGPSAFRNFLETFFSGSWIFAFGTLIGVVAVAMTLSRGGSMAGIVGLAVFFWAVRRGTGEGRLALLAIPVALVLFALVFMSSGIIDRVKFAEQDLRWPMYREVVHAITLRPWLGHGGGAFSDAFTAYAPLLSSGKDWHFAHNSYLENAFEFGLPAAAMFYAALALVGWRLLRGVMTRRRHQIVPAFALACFAAGAVHATVDFSLQYPAIAALFAAILGLGWGQSFPKRRPLGDR